MSEETPQTPANQEQKPDSTPGASPHPKSGEEKTFTQTEVSKIMAREKNQGRTAVYKELGIDPKNTDTIDEIKNYIQSKKPESQKLAEQKVAEAAKIKEAEQRAFIAEVKAEIMQSGVQLAYLDDAMALVTAKKTDDTFDLSAAIENIKTKYPVWFTAEPPSAAAGQQQAGRKGTGSPIQPGSSVQNQTDNLGKRLAEQRKSSSVKSTHWGNK